MDSVGRNSSCSGAWYRLVPQPAGMWLDKSCVESPKSAILILIGTREAMSMFCVNNKREPTQTSICKANHWFQIAMTNLFVVQYRDPFQNLPCDFSDFCSCLCRVSRKVQLEVPVLDILHCDVDVVLVFKPADERHKFLALWFVSPSYTRSEDLHLHLSQP